MNNEKLRNVNIESTPTHWVAIKVSASTVSKDNRFAVIKDNTDVFVIWASCN